MANTLPPFHHQKESRPLLSGCILQHTSCSTEECGVHLSARRPDRNNHELSLHEFSYSKDLKHAFFFQSLLNPHFPSNRTTAQGSREDIKTHTIANLKTSHHHEPSCEESTFCFNAFSSLRLVISLRRCKARTDSCDCAPLNTFAKSKRAGKLVPCCFQTVNRSACVPAEVMALSKNAHVHRYRFLFRPSVHKTS